LVSFDSTNVEIAGRLISLFFGTLTLIPVFYLVKEVVGQKGAIFSGLFYSFHPYLVTYSGMLLSEATYWGLLTLSVYFFWMGLKRGKILGLIVSGLFLALAYLQGRRELDIYFCHFILVFLEVNKFN
jgi:asparagine N-glycosylation enzyme membrane subunit Stt3